MIFFFFPFLASESGGFSSVDLKGTLTERVDNYEKEKDDMKETVIKLSEKALEVSSNATATKDDALALEKEIMEALNKTHGMNIESFHCTMRYNSTFM